MSTHKHFDKICCCIIIFSLLITSLLIYIGYTGDFKKGTDSKVTMGYENKLFDTSKVHQINIEMQNWEEFLADCQSEEYYVCNVTIDEETFDNVAIRGKGNTSLTQVSSYGNDRYSFKIEFDHYENANTYYGLDKLCLNNMIQDNTYMKDYLTYQMMADMGVAAPLCSYVYITVNGEDWGLYLAVEGIEESFLQRNYGNEYGDLYKPDSMSMGGGRGNGERFDMDEFMNEDMMGQLSDFGELQGSGQMPEGGFPQGNQGQMPEGGFPQGNQGQMPEGGFPQGNQGQMPEGGFPQGNQGQMPEGDFQPPNQGEMPNLDEMPSFDGMQNFMPGGMGFSSDDVLLKYIDDNISSYSNIFDNAKTNVTTADKSRLIDSLEKLNLREDLENTVDIETVIKYFVVHNFVVNFDSYTGSMIHNYYLYEEDGQLEMIPWDYNLAFGGFSFSEGATNLVNYPIDSPVSSGDTSERPMIAWIFENETYTELYHAYFEEFMESYFTNGYFEVMIEELTSMLAPYVEKDPTKFCTYEEFESGVETLKEFCLLRAESICGQLEGSIGSTTETQKEETLIDASHLQIEQMGSMQNSMGNQMPNKFTQ